MSRLTRLWFWLLAPTRRPYFVIAAAAVLVGTGLLVAVQHQNDVERHQRAAAIALAIKVQHAADSKATERIYRSQLASCGRGISLRLQVRENALAEAKVYRVLRGFLQGARPRAFAQSQDPNISAQSRLGAKKSLVSIDNGIAALSAHVAIPPVPTPCDQVITDPNAPALPRHS
jgi:hypothetical protein